LLAFEGPRPSWSRANPAGRHSRPSQALTSLETVSPQATKEIFIVTHHVFLFLFSSVIQQVRSDTVLSGDHRGHLLVGIDWEQIANRQHNHFTEPCTKAELWERARNKSLMGHRRQKKHKP
jgi:hypothetical protein